MSTQDEKKDLVKNPLPVDAMVFASCPPDEVLQNIAYLTEAIESTQDHVNYLQRQLDVLKGRAIAENINESGEYYLVEIPGKKLRNPIDILKLRVMHVYEYKRIRLHQMNDLINKFEKDRDNIESTPIPLLLADKVVGSEMITNFVGYQPQKVAVEVRRKVRQVQ
jgi:hypothetical protein